MKCEDGKHGASYCDFRGRWSCIICGESIDPNKKLPEKTVPKIEEHKEENKDET